MPLIFDDGDAANNRSFLNDDTRHRPNNVLVAEPAGGGMHGGSPVALAQTNDRHLHQAAAQRSAEISMRFDAVDQHDAIRSKRLHTAKDGNAVLSRADLPR